MIHDISFKTFIVIGMAYRFYFVAKIFVCQIKWEQLEGGK